MRGVGSDAGKKSAPFLGRCAAIHRENAPPGDRKLYPRGEQRSSQIHTGTPLDEIQLVLNRVRFPK